MSQAAETRPAGSKPQGNKQPQGQRPVSTAQSQLEALERAESVVDQAEAGTSLSGADNEILARLQRLEQELAAAQAENAALLAQQDASLGGRRLSAESKPFAPKVGSYRFRCGPLKPDEYPHLPIVEEDCCDESEMIRWYCATHPAKPGSNKQLDPGRIKLRVECVDRRRAANQILKQRIAVLRTKISTGASLSPEDQQLAEQFEAEVYGFSN